MAQRELLLSVLGIAALAALVSQSADASVAQDPYTPALPPEDGYQPDDFYEPDTAGVNVSADQVASASPDARVFAFLAMLRKFESNNDYTVITGGQHFNSFIDHPRIRVYFYDPRRPGPKGTPNNWSDAAGGYQNISTTWDALARRLDLTDFSPASQDAANVELLREIGALEAIERGDITTALRRASTRWASLPGSMAQQNPQTLAAALDTFASFLPA